MLSIHAMILFQWCDTFLMSSSWLHYMLSERIRNLKTNDRHSSQLGCRHVGICAGFFRGGMTSNKKKTINVCPF